VISCDVLLLIMVMHCLHCFQLFIMLFATIVIVLFLSLFKILLYHVVYVVICCCTILSKHGSFILFILLFFVLSTLFNAFVIYCYKSLPCIVDIVAISVSIDDKYCLGYIHVIISNIVIPNCLYCLHCF
jgi:hypothetical protein